ncbi:amino acid permease, partial [bacterium]|nr:amino acid permease [bacterium]
FVLNGMVAILTAGAYAELGSAFPEAGGGLSWVALGYHRAMAFITGWLGWFSHTVACSVYALGFGVYLLEALNFFGLIGHPDEIGGYSLWVKVGALGICAFLGWINFQGVSETGRVGSIMSVLKVAILLVFAGFGFAKILGDPEALANYTPFLLSDGVYSPGVLVLLAMGVTYMAFEGYEVIVQAAEETVDPKRNIPRAIFTAMGIVLPVYLLVGGATLGALRQTPAFTEAVSAAVAEGSQVAATNANFMAFLGGRAVVEAANQFMLPVPFPGSAYSVGMFLLILAGLASTFSALNGTMFSSSRVAFAMGRGGYVPPQLGAVHPVRRTPHIGLLVTVAMAMLIAVALPMAAVAAAANIMFLLLFTMVNLALIRLRHTHPDTERGFRMPLVPLLPILAIVIQLIIAVAVFFIPYHPLAMGDGSHAAPGAIAWVLTAVWVIGGLLLYAGPFRDLQPMAETRVAAEKAYHAKMRHRVLVAAGLKESVPALARMAAALAGAREGSVHAMSVSVLPEATPLSAATERHTRKAAGLVEELMTHLRRVKAIANSTVVIAHEAARGITATARTREADFILVGWRGKRRRGGVILGDTLDRVLAEATVPVGVLKGEGKGPWKRVFAAVAGGPNTPAVIDAAADIASTFAGTLTLGAVARAKDENSAVDEALAAAAKRARERQPDLEVE